MRDLTLQRLVMLVFFVQPFAFGSWLPRIPEVQERLGLGPAALSLALLGMPAGILAVLPFAGRLVARIGARATIVWGLLVFSLLVWLPAVAAGTATLFAALLVLGASMATLELGLNVAADGAEKRSGRLIMSTCHGFWSLGIMAGSLAGVGFAWAGVAPGPAVALASAAALLAGWTAAWRLPDLREANEAPPAAHPKRPSPALFGVCLFVFGVTMAEGAAADWSAVFLRDVFGQGRAAAGLGYVVFAACVAAGRFGGDRLKARFGPVRLARAAGAVALAGLCLVAASPLPGLALAGFALMGLGLSVGFPLAVTAAADQPDRPAAASVAILSFVALIGFLVGPPLIGFVAEHAGMRWGLAMLAPMLALSLAFAGRLAQHPPKSA